MKVVGLIQNPISAHYRRIAVATVGPEPEKRRVLRLAILIEVIGDLLTRLAV